MSELHKVAEASQQPARGAVVFVHGLGGDAVSTWAHDKEHACYWPQWIADDLAQVDVYSLAYEASPSAWLGTTMPLFDRAKQVLARLEEVAQKPLVFVCHSLGGLLVKELIHQGTTGGVDDWKPVAEQTRGVVFLATPHTGADLAGTINKLGKVLRTTVSVEELEKSEPQLRRLNEWYQNNAPALGVKTLSFYEKKRIGRVLVVDESSANPGINGAASVPSDEDHFGICKPKSRETLRHSKTRRFIQECLDSTATAEAQDALRNSEGSAASSRENTGPAKLFISYKRSIPVDEELAQFLRRGLQVAGHEVFIDVGMTAGTDWVAEISRRIGWCDYLVVLLSEAATQSEMVQAEVRLAHQRRGSDGRPRILPIRVNYEGPLGYELDAYLSRIQYAKWRNKRDSEKVLAHLSRAIEEAISPVLPDTLSLDQLDTKAPADTTRDRLRPSASDDPRVLAPPGGTIKIDDEFYVRRNADAQIDGHAALTGQTVVIKAARQMGKSSLLIRYLTTCKERGKQLAFIDFQSFSDAELHAYPSLLQAICRILFRQLRLDGDPEPTFASPLEFTDFLEDSVLKPLGAPVTIAMDEVDRVLGRSYQGEFFGMLRHWHNQRAQPLSPWAEVDLALVISTEPYLLISSENQSPFNVTPPIELKGFDRPDLDQLNKAFGDPLSPVELDQLHDLLNGQPYLTRLAFYRLVTPPRPDFETILADAPNSDGPFGDHLKSKLFLLKREPDLLGEMRQLIAGHSKPDSNVYYRLHGAGLAEREGAQAIPANMLYARFFKQVQ